MRQWLSNNTQEDQMHRSSLWYAATAGAAAVALSVAGCGDEGPAAPEQTAAPEAAASAVATDRYIVVMKEGRTGALSINGVTSDLSRLGGRVERSQGEIGVVQARLTPAAAAQLAKRSDVEAVAKDRTVQWIPPREQRVNFAQRLRSESNQRGAQFFDRFQWNIRKIQAQRAWNVSSQGAGVTVCLLDSGVDPRQIELEGKLNLSISASFVGNERADRDFAGHGTYMASIITSNGLGIASVAPDARVCSVKVLGRDGRGDFGDLIAAIQYVGGLGVDVANMSLGALVPRNDPDVQALIRALQRAVNFATNHGVLLVASAGNESTNLNDDDVAHLPSDLDHVISVGATGPIGQERFDRVASYSNFGREGVSVFAPGGEDAFADNVIEDLIIGACSPSFVGAFACDDRISYLIGDGTSQSAAHVSGEAAVIEAELPGNQTPAQLTGCILQTADPLPNPLKTANGRINVFAGQACGSASVASK
jgi:lantibiotic leader peptide-processing serine protease